MPWVTDFIWDQITNQSFRSPFPFQNAVYNAGSAVVAAYNQIDAMTGEDPRGADPGLSDFKKLQFPTDGGAFGADTINGQIPYAIRFVAAPYKNKQFLREDAPESGKVDVILPLPRDLSVDNRIKYSSGQTETTGGLFDMTTGGWGQFFETWGGIRTWGRDLFGWSKVLGQRPMDERDQIFAGAEFREHNYSWVLVPRNEADGTMIQTISEAFQVFAYPQKANEEAYSRIIHPSVWFITVMDMSKDKGKIHKWAMNPLPSVLQGAKITTAGAAGGMYASVGGYPAATKIDLRFIELEPAINNGRYLQSRSQLRASGGTRGGD